MLLRLFLLFTIVPIVELYLLIQLGGVIGMLPTIALVIATGAAGAAMARREGLRSWLAVQAELAQGRLPGTELLHSLLILIAGIVLVTPGIITDLAGILLLARPTRVGLIRVLKKRFEGQLVAAGPVGNAMGPGFQMFWEGPGAGGMQGPEPDDARRSGADPDGRSESDPPRPRIIEL